jgi:TonB-linked SusC/RagA family outer membrane protein
MEKTKRSPGINIFFSRYSSSLKNIVRVLLMTVLFLSLNLAQIMAKASFSQQPKSVTGIVTDLSGATLPGVSVVIKGTTKGTITDGNGSFSLTNIPESAVLQFSFVGMKRKEVNIDGKSQINVSLEEETIGLDEVVAVGYGTQKKVNLTGSVSTVQSKDLVKVPTANVSEALTGKASGLFTKQGQGVPGSDYATISIRGYDEPLILVDGIETSWSRMDQNEIESISVLKDAAAAVYGARAGNGVILITTKRGMSNKPSIIYTSNYSFQSPTTVPEFVSSAKYTELLREGQFNLGLPYTYSEEDIQKYKEGDDPDYVNEDWYKAAFREWSPMHSHNLAVRGGNDKVKYYMSVGYLDQSGAYKSGDLNFSRYNARSNVDAQITDRLSVSIDMSYRNEERKAPQTSLDNIWINLKTALPVWRATLPDPQKGGAYSGFLERSPVAQTISDMTGFNDDIQRYFTGKINLKYKIPGIEGLEANASLNYSVNNKYNKIQDKPFKLFSYDYKNQVYIPWGSNGSNSLDETTSNFTQFYPLVSLSYDRKFNNHAIQGLLLAEGINTDYSFLSAGRVDLLSLDVPYLFAGSPDNLTNNGGAVETGRISYVGRANYSFKEKYLLEGTLRYDASHKFPEDSRWGFFPSVSVGWRVSEESFIKDNFSWVNNLKLRTSYSKSGNDNVEAFKYLTGYEIQTDPTKVYVFGSNAYRRITSTGLPNPDITWLDMTSYNIGLDGSFMNGLIGFEFDLFNRITDNIFGQPLETYPSTFGATLPLINLNSTEDRGFELKLTHRNKIGKDFSYNIAGSVSLAREEYKKWSESNYDDEDEIRIYKKTGKYTNRWIGYKSDGLFMTQEEINNHSVNQDQANNKTLRPGDIRYIDLNDDKIIDWRDQDVIGYGTFPDLTYALNVEMQYKAFSLTALFQGASMFNSMIADALRGPLTNQGNAFEFQYQYRWQPDPNNPGVSINPETRLPSISPEGTNPNNNKTSDFWLQDATYLRLKNLNLSYTLPKRLVTSIGMQDINVYVGGSNLFTLSNLGIYKRSVDPEATDYQKFYPPVKTISFGLNITL